MKTIHLINQIATGLTIALYLTIICGMYAQIILGPLQLLLAGIVTYSYYKRLDEAHQTQLIRYWIAATITLVLAGITVYYIDNFTFGLLMIIPLFILPMAVAIYFTVITGSINNYLKSIQDKIQ